MRKRITYANLMSTFAVFLALGGVSYAAATLPKNSVGSKQIKKNAVTGAKIKKNAVTGAKIKRATITGEKIKDGSIAGRDINSSSLGVVPKAASADRAGTVDDRFSVVKRGVVTASDDEYEVALANATAVPLYSYGPFTLYGKCFKEADADNVQSAIFVSTSEDNVLMTLYNVGPYGGSFGPATPEESRYLTWTGVNNGNTGSSQDYDSSFMVNSAGKGLRVSTLSSVTNDESPTPSYYPSPESCVWAAEGSQLQG